jgi:hypothetical protein
MFSVINGTAGLGRILSVSVRCTTRSGLDVLLSLEYRLNGNSSFSDASFRLAFSFRCTSVGSVDKI